MQKFFFIKELSYSLWIESILIVGVSVCIDFFQSVSPIFQAECYFIIHWKPKIPGWVLLHTMSLIFQDQLDVIK